MQTGFHTDNGKENGSYCNGLYRDYVGVYRVLYGITSGTKAACHHSHGDC